jgi:exodeoxyribonuclease-3
VRIASLNIRHGGSRRIPSIIDWVDKADADFITFSEWRPNQCGEVLAGAMQDRGYSTHGISQGPSVNGILMASRCNQMVSNITPEGALHGEIAFSASTNLDLICCYFPQKHEKITFFHAVTDRILQASAPTILIGDLNTGLNGIDLTTGATPFFCSKEFAELESLGGAKDLWRHSHGKYAREWSWCSRNNGFRIDHAYGNEALFKAYPSIFCRYDHSTRTEGISDHSAILVELENPALF